MNVWDVVLLAATGIGLLGLASLVLPGVSQYVSAFMSKFVDVVMKVITTVFEHMPKPVKILVVILMFGAVGGMVYNFTIGSQYICSDNEVYKVPFTSGLAMHMIPGKSLIGNEIEVNLEIDSKITETNLVDMRIEEEAGRTYGVVRGVAAPSRLSGSRDLGTIVRLLPVQQFNTFWTGGLAVGNVELIPDQYALYDVCLDADDNTCVLLRNHAAVIGADACNPTSGGGWEGWSYPVGSIYYEYRNSSASDNEIYASVHPRRPGTSLSTIISFIFGNVIQKDMDDCKRSDDLDTRFQGVELQFIHNPLLAGPKPYKVPLYNAEFGPIMAANNNPKNNVEEGRLFFSTPSSKVNFDEDLANVGKKGENTALAGTVEFACASTEDKPYATTMLFMGIEVFNITTLVFLFAIMAILGFWAYIMKFM